MPGRRTGRSGQWWAGVPGRLRKPYAFLAFPPVTPVESIVALATSAICAAGGWQPVTDTGEGWYAWRRRTAGPALTLVVAGSLPVIVAMVPGSRVGAPGRTGVEWPLPRRAATSAQLRFIRAAQRQGARIVATAALPDLVAQSAARWEHWDLINHRLAEIAEGERTRACPRCEAGSQPTARWCPRCEYEFGQGDDHARDRAVLTGRREAEQLRRAQAQLAAESFPPLPMPGVPGPPAPGWGGPR